MEEMKGVVKGIVVLDVVEGTAMASFGHIAGFVNSRPESFSSIAQAIRWTLDSGVVKNKDSARVSVPGQLVKQDDGLYHWRTNVIASKEYWEGWYKDMSNLFLSVPLPKILMVAGTERLDTTLTIGQMQGKYQLEVVMNSGHQIHEDAVDTVVEQLQRFTQRV